MKIVYAAANYQNSKIQLFRFMEAMKNSNHTIKIATYKNSKPNNVSVDWTLDCLLKINNPEYFHLNNDNFRYYLSQIESFKPDLIISDLENYTSYIATILKIPLWQCSSMLINYSLPHKYKYDLGLHKTYSFILKKHHIRNQRIMNLIDNSNCNFVYSHLGDTDFPPAIESNFEFIRPYHKIGKDSTLCQHNVVAATLSTNKRIIGMLKTHLDSVCFTEVFGEEHNNPIMKSLINQEEYLCNLKNSNLFVTEGQTSFLADAFYNNKQTAVLVNIEDPECIVNSMIASKIGISSFLTQAVLEEKDFNQKFNIKLNPNIKFLHQKIEEFSNLS